MRKWRMFGSKMGHISRMKTFQIRWFCRKFVACRTVGPSKSNTTKKLRAVGTFPTDMAFVQVAAGSVHSLVLTTDGRVFSCGINEKGIVPVQGLEAEGTTDTFSEIVFTTDIQRLGKIVQITAGASSLTEKGSVIAWGNCAHCTDTQGEVKVHETLTDIQKKPMVVMAG
ncbi:hypothetical protein niasHT_039584 [Heterodera trifolii]|uniref:Uncharacterized protein n=1 Tax=Heterodera trifolii TaxID=157864 RepID=A0ABD2IC30_9BILA